MAGRAAQVPPITAAAVKDTINHTLDTQGQRESWRYHFMVHQFVSNTADALGRTEARREGGMDAVQGRAGRYTERRIDLMAGTAHRAPGPRSRHPHRRAVLRGPARRAGRGGHQDRAARHRRLHARDRAVPPRATTSDGSPGYSLFWAVEGRGRKSVTLNLRTPEGQDLFRRLAATADVVVENFRPGTLERWNIAPTDLDERLVTVRISTFGQDGPYSERPGLDRVGIGYGGLLHLTGYPDRPPVRVGVTISDYLTGVFAAQAATAALYARDVHRSGKGAVIDAALYGASLRVLEWTIAAYDRLGVVRSREGNRLANSAPLDNYPTADGKYVCIVAGSDANFARLCRAMDAARAHRRPALRPARRPRRAQRRDQRDRRRLDRGPRRGRSSKPRASRTTSRSRPRTPRPTCSSIRTSRPAATS